MRYFTRALLERFASPNDAVADGAHEEWERALGRCRRRWQKIRSRFPLSVRRFEAESVCLHDAQVLSIAHKGQNLAMALRPEAPSETLVLLTFTLAGDLIIDRQAISGHGGEKPITWLYEEWDVDRRGACWFEVLLSNGWSVRFPFRDFRYLVLPSVLPDGNGWLAKGVPVPADLPA